MPHEILKQLLQTEKQGNGTGAALCVYPLPQVNIMAVANQRTEANQKTERAENYR